MANPKKIGAAPAPQRGGGGARRAPSGPTISPDEIPSWQQPSSQALESAAREERPLVIYFPSEGANDSEFYGEALARLSESDAVFIRVPFTSDREKSPWAEETAVPTSKLLSDNPSRDYKVPVGKATVIIADSWGNEHYRPTALPTADQIRSQLKKVREAVSKDNDKLQKTFEKAKAAHEASNRKEALKHIFANFKEDVVGLPAQEETIRLYHEIMDAARTEIGELKAAGNKDALKTLAKDLKKTDVEKDIDEALKELK